MKPQNQFISPSRKIDTSDITDSNSQIVNGPNFVGRKRAPGYIQKNWCPSFMLAASTGREGNQTVSHHVIFYDNLSCPPLNTLLGSEWVERRL
jgi:hypothetical protein